jgi:hypothetical protein
MPHYVKKLWEKFLLPIAILFGGMNVWHTKTFWSVGKEWQLEINNCFVF